MVKELVCGHGNECSIPSNDILNLVLNDYNMITCVFNDYKMTTYFYFRCKSTWTLHIVILDMTWHHVMLSCLNKLSSMTLVIMIVIQSNITINPIVNMVVFFFKSY
jgi:hypothetical protein